VATIASMRGKQLTISVGNRPGEIAKICQALAEGEVNIRALSTTGDYDVGALRIVVDDDKKAKAALARSGHMCMETDVLLIEETERVGSAAEVTGKLGSAGVNINYMYASSAGAGRSLMILGVPDVEKAERALSR
jgi:hypothetical protein